MSKIIIISVAVTAFCLNLQIVRPDPIGLFDNPILNGVKDVAKEVQNIIPNIGHNAVQTGENIVSGLSNGVDKLKDDVDKLLNGFGGNRTACISLYSEAVAALSELSSILYSCASETSQSAISNIQNITESAKNLQAKLIKDLRNLAGCFTHPTTLAKCVSQAGGNVTGLIPAFEQIVSSLYDLLMLFPGLKVCVVSSTLGYVEQNISGVLGKALQCVESII